MPLSFVLESRGDFTNLYFLITIFLYLSIFVTIFILIPAAFNVSLGVLKFYVGFLLFFFDWGKRKVCYNKKLQKKLSQNQFHHHESSPPSEGGSSEDSSKKIMPNGVDNFTSDVDVASQNCIRNRVSIKEISSDLDTDEESNLSEDLNSSDFSHLIEKTNTHGFAEYCRQLYQPCYERLLSDQHYDLSDISFYIRAGIDSIVQDGVTHCFQAEELKSWNFLTRTNHIYKHDMGVRLSLIWFFGFILRYFVMFPIRATIFIIGVGTYANCTLLVSFIPQCKFKEVISKRLSLMSYRVLCRGFSAIIRFHNRENLPKGGGVCVANHTSPIDALILSCDNCYVLIGQRHSGFTGFMQDAMSKLDNHVWFERSHKDDRASVVKKVAEHASDPSKTPILIFPEGTCINNTSVMMFRKGSFEYSDLVYPVAIKYDPRFGDAFWNSSQHSMLRYLLHMMTSWAIVCDVWYLPPVQRLPNEDVISFAYRVKRLIAHQGGLVDLEWDGNLKRSKVNPQHLDKQKQKTFVQTRASSNNLLNLLDSNAAKECQSNLNQSNHSSTLTSRCHSSNDNGSEVQVDSDNDHDGPIKLKIS